MMDVRSNKKETVVLEPCKRKYVGHFKGGKKKPYIGNYLVQGMMNIASLEKAWGYKKLGKELGCWERKEEKKWGG